MREEIKQPMGLVHGGLYASLAESMTSLATAVAVMSGRQDGAGHVEQHELSAPDHRGTRARACRSGCIGGRTTWMWDVTLQRRCGPDVRGDADDDRGAAVPGGQLTLARGA